MFHGTGRCLSQENTCYDPYTRVLFNPTAYNNEILFLTYIQDFLISAIISKKRVCSGGIGIASGRRKSFWIILSAQPALRGPQPDGCILFHWVQHNPYPVRPVHAEGQFHTVIS